MLGLKGKNGFRRILRIPIMQDGDRDKVRLETSCEASYKAAEVGPLLFREMRDERSM